MAAITWLNFPHGDHLWTDPANWSSGTEPGPADDVTIGYSGVLLNSASDTVDSLMIVKTGPSTGSLTLNSAELTVSSGGSSVGSITVNDGSALTLSGTFTNTGKISLNGNVMATDLLVAGSLVLAGKGKLILSDDPDNNIVSNGSPASVTTSNIISGAGTIGDADLTLTNTGTIDASGGNTLTIDTDDNVITNSGTLEATQGGGGLTILGVVNNVGGVIYANGMGSQVDISNAVIEGGKLQASNGDINVSSTGTAILDGTASTVTLAGSSTGTTLVNDAANLTVLGTIDLTGDGLTLAGAGDTTELVIEHTVTLIGGGTLTLADDGGGNLIGGIGPDATLINNSTISGTGQIGDVNLTINNETKGVIEDDTGDSPLMISASYLSNEGTIKSDNGSDVVITGVVDNTGASDAGIIRAINGSLVDLDNAYIEGGALKTDTNASSLIETGYNLNSGSATLDATLDGRTAPVNIDGNVLVNDDTSLGLAGTININKLGQNKNGGPDPGSLTLSSQGNQTVLQIDADTTLGGEGDVILADNGSGVSPVPNIIEGTLLGTTLTNDDVIEGAGQIQRLDITNNGTIDANQADPLSIDTGASSPVTNKGTLGASNGGSLLVAGNVTNTGGTILANGGNVTVDDDVTGGSVQIGGAGDAELGLGTDVAASFLAGASGSLVLDNSMSFTGTIAGLLAGGGSIDLRDLAYIAGTTTASFTPTSTKPAAGIMTVTDGSPGETTVLNFAQSISGTIVTSSDGVAGADGYTGTLVTLQPTVADAANVTSHGGTAA